VAEIGTTQPADFKRYIGRNEEAVILADKNEFIGNNANETVTGGKQIAVGGTLVISAGSALAVRPREDGFIEIYAKGIVMNVDGDITMNASGTITQRGGVPV
jgi:hypothetical protein